MYSFFRRRYSFAASRFRCFVLPSEFATPSLPPPAQDGRNFSARVQRFLCRMQGVGSGEGSKTAERLSTDTKFLVKTAKLFNTDTKRLDQMRAAGRLGTGVQG